MNTPNNENNDKKKKFEIKYFESALEKISEKTLLNGTKQYLPNQMQNKIVKIPMGVFQVLSETNVRKKKKKTSSSSHLRSIVTNGVKKLCESQTINQFREVKKGS